jgi:hypothetical protein
LVENDGSLDRDVSLVECRACQQQTLKLFLSLGQIPLVNAFVASDALDIEEKRFPLDVVYCTECGMVQLADVVPPSEMFSDYPYFTGASDPMRRHFDSMTDEIVESIEMTEGDIAVDIGSNDGTLLMQYPDWVSKLGIEPSSNLAEDAEGNGITTICEFISEEVAEQTVAKYGNASVVTATNVFAHVDDIRGFLRSVRVLLGDSGVLVIEAPYLRDMLDHVEFDTIYHEHLSYFAVRPLLSVFESQGFEVADVKRVPVHGGSLRIYARPSANAKHSAVAEAFVADELESGLGSERPYLQFAQDVKAIRTRLLELLGSLKESGKIISAYGAPAKGNTLLNYCGISTDVIDYATDTTEAKQGKYTPGTRIPVVDPSMLIAKTPDYALLLAWNYKDAILEKESDFRGNGGKFIVPIPFPTLE